MSPDVKELTGEPLASGRFPVDSRADFRLYMSPDVRRGIEAHAKADVGVEICGVLVGHWERDEDGPYARVTDFIRCENATSKFAEVTFTHESWAQINKEMDSRHADARIIGWYHSHPDFGIFLSDRDCFIQQHFFSGPGQVAYVIDPVRDLEGVFAWHNGKPTLLPHFWVGNSVRTAAASERSASDAKHSPSSLSPVASPADGPLGGLSTFGWATAALALLIAFWLGHIYGSWRSRWEQRMIIEGAVAHFADTRIIREGLESELSAVRARLKIVADELGQLPAPTAELSPEQAAEAVQCRTRIADDLALCNGALARIEQRYGLDDVERGFLARIVAQKQAELRQLLDRQQEKARSDQPPNAAPKSKTSPPAAKEQTPSTPSSAGSPQLPAPSPPARPPQ
jgi:proteasome lid subunit RPN8/RPN11